MTDVAALPRELYADVVLHHGNIITVDGAFSTARAVAVKDGRFIFVGTDGEAARYAGPATRVIDLKGLTVLPGINDAHVHASLYGGSRPPLTVDISPPAVRTIDQLVRKIAEAAQSAAPDEWIKAAEFNPEALEECGGDPPRLPSRRDLDRAAPRNPVVAGGIPFRFCPAILLNSRALENAGITRDTIVPLGVEIVKDVDTGEPTGLIRGMNPEGLLEGIIPLLARAQKEQAVLTAMRELNALGITSITEPGLGPGGTRSYRGLWDNECVHVYTGLHKAGQLTLRVTVLLLLTPYGACYPEQFVRYLSGIGTPSGFGSEWLRIGGIKLFADGIPPMKTAWMYEPYADGTRGKPVFPGRDDEEAAVLVDKIVSFAHDQGFQIAVHATGDKAIDVFVDSFSRAEVRKPSGLRHYVVHGDFVTPRAMRKMARHGIGMTVQPALMDIMAPRMSEAVGSGRMAAHMPLKQARKMHVHVSGGSDAPVTGPDWKFGVQSAVSSFPHRKIGIEDAIRMYTIEGAWQDGMERVKGSIEPGKLADLCVLDADITRTAPEKITSLKTVLTMVGGKIVYGPDMEN